MTYVLKRITFVALNNGWSCILIAIFSTDTYIIDFYNGNE